VHWALVHSAPRRGPAGPAQLSVVLLPRCRARTTTRRRPPRCRSSRGAPAPIRGAPSLSSPLSNPNPHRPLSLARRSLFPTSQIRARALPSPFDRRRRGHRRREARPSCPAATPASTTPSPTPSRSREPRERPRAVTPISSDSGVDPSSPAASRLPRAGAQRLQLAVSLTSLPRFSFSSLAHRSHGAVLARAHLR
jgi:hypothetical protein